MRLIDADELKKWLKSPVGFRANCEYCTSIDCLDCITEEAIDNAPTIEAAPINNNPCGFCGKFNFGDAKAEVYRHGANIVIASALARFPVEEQFNFCPVCGRCVKKGGASND